MEEKQTQWLDIKKKMKGWQGCKNKKNLNIKMNKYERERESE